MVTFWGNFRKNWAIVWSHWAPDIQVDQPEHWAEDQQVAEERDEDEDSVEHHEDGVPRLVQASVQPVELHQVVVDAGICGRHLARLKCRFLTL